MHCGQADVQTSRHAHECFLWCVQQQHALETEETCTQYNMLKIARYLFTWTGNVTYADYYERAMLNGLLGTQRMPASQSPSVAMAHQQHQKSYALPLATEIHSPTDAAATQAALYLPDYDQTGAMSRWANVPTFNFDGLTAHNAQRAVL